MTHETFRRRRGPKRMLKSLGILLAIVTAVSCTMVISRVASAEGKKGDLNSNLISPEGGSDMNKTKIVYRILDDSPDSTKYAAYEASDLSITELSIQRWAEIMSTDESEEEANVLTSILKSAPYQAFFFETKGSSSLNSKTKQFEFILVDSPSLFIFCESSPDPNAFSEHFNSCTPSSHEICSFNNLGGDALLVAPKPRPTTADSKYSHLGSFVRGAPSDQIRYIWKKVAQEYLQLFKNNPQQTFWLSTCGLGVSWLHFRVDTTPKYYSYAPFARET